MKLDPLGAYLMPVGFGQQRPHSAGVFEDVWTLSVQYRTETDVLAEFLPEPFGPAEEPIVTVKCQMLRRVNVLAGGGYNLVGIDLAARFNGPAERLDGDFSLVIWENNAIPIIRGREVLGLPKVYGDIPDPLLAAGEWRAHCTENGRTLIEMHAIQGRRWQRHELRELNARTGRHYFGWKYVPNVDGIGAAVSYPVSVGINEVIDSAWDADGTVTYGDVSMATNPQSSDIVTALRRLVVKDYLAASITRGSMTITRAKHRALLLTTGTATA